MAHAVASILCRNLSRLRINPALTALQIHKNYSDSSLWKPGPPPVTEEQRRAAAAKYNLIPEDYDVWDEKEGYGDYPKFQGAGFDARDPFDDYDDEYERYFYGEPVHIDSILWGPAGMNPDWQTYKPSWYYPLVSVGFVASWVIVDSILDYYDIRLNSASKPKQFPGVGKVHYTFDPEYD